MPDTPLPTELLAALQKYTRPHRGSRSISALDRHPDWPSGPTLHRALAGGSIRAATVAQIKAALKKHAPHLMGENARGEPALIDVLRAKAIEAGFGELSDEQLMRVHRAIEPLLEAQLSFAAKS